jgi:hypothetical protein
MLHARSAVLYLTISSRSIVCLCCMSTHIHSVDWKRSCRFYYTSVCYRLILHFRKMSEIGNFHCGVNSFGELEKWTSRLLTAACSFNCLTVLPRSRLDLAILAIELKIDWDTLETMNGRQRLTNWQTVSWSSQ